jgi:fermentation-respiration switch protein FrsA (DUF1100 family)
VLIVQGTNDLQVTVPDAERLGAAAKDAKVHIVEGMNHVLKHTGPTALEQQLTYVLPLAPLAPGLADAIADFVRGDAPPLKPPVAKDR